VLSVGRRRWFGVALLLLMPVSLVGCSTSRNERRNRRASLSTQISAEVSGAVAVLRKPSQGLPQRLSPVARTRSGEVTLTRGWPVLMTLEHQVWVTAAGRRLCLVDHSSGDGTGVTCALVQRILRHGISSTFLQDGPPGSPSVRSIVGLMPDQAARVRIFTPGFPAVTVPVVHNVFVRTDRIPQPPESIELLGSGS
jgi:hypothetical protein